MTSTGYSRPLRQASHQILQLSPGLFLLCSMAAMRARVPRVRGQRQPIAELVFWSILGCMSARVHHEMNVEPQTSPSRIVSRGQGRARHSPQQQQMHRGGGANYTGAVVVKPAVTAAQRQPVAQHGYISQPQPVAQHGYIGAPAAQNMMQVVCPQGAGPGTCIQVADSFGRIVQVVIPQGVFPGQAFMVATGAPVQPVVVAAAPLY